MVQVGCIARTVSEMLSRKVDAERYVFPQRDAS